MFFCLVGPIVAHTPNATGARKVEMKVQKCKILCVCVCACVEGGGCFPYSIAHSFGLALSWSSTATGMSVSAGLLGEAVA